MKKQNNIIACILIALGCSCQNSKNVTYKYLPTDFRQIEFSLPDTIIQNQIGGQKLCVSNTGTDRVQILTDYLNIIPSTVDGRTLNLSNSNLKIAYPETNNMSLPSYSQKWHVENNCLDMIDKIRSILVQSSCTECTMVDVEFPDVVKDGHHVVTFIISTSSAFKKYCPLIWIGEFHLTKDVFIVTR